jgi:NitT/TauT family transport system substrate-binding protein
MKHHRVVTSLLLALTLGTALVGCANSPASPESSSDAETVEPAELAVGFDNPLAYANNMPVLIAIDQGFFEEQQLTVTTVGFSGGSDATRALVSGAINLQAGVGFDSVAANTNDLDVKIVYTIARDTDFVLYGSTAAGITEPSDLDGGSLAISAFGSFSDYLARSTAPAIGLDADSIEITALGTNPALFAAIDSGTVGGTWNPASLASVITGSTILATTTSLEIPTQYSSVIAAGDWLADNGDVVRRFNVALEKAIAWHQDPANRDAAIELAVTVMELPEDSAAAGYDGAFEIYTEDGMPSVEGLEAMASAVPDLGLGDDVPDVDSLYTNDYLPGN